MVNSTKTATTSPVETTNYNTTESGINSTQLDSTKMYDKKTSTSALDIIRQSTLRNPQYIKILSTTTAIVGSHQ